LPQWRSPHPILFPWQLPDFIVYLFRAPPAPFRFVPRKAGLSPRIMRILFADDQEDIRLLTKQHLEKKGHRVTEVANGQEALRALRQQTFDLILLDQEMPGMTGSEVLRAIRSAQNTSAATKVFALTGYNTDDDKQRLLQAGFDAVIGKPFRLDALETTLRSATEKHHGSAPQTPSSPAAPALFEEPLARLGGDQKLLRRVAAAFLRELPKRLAALQKSITQKRGDDLAAHAHALKGSLSVFSADHAVVLCQKLQEFGRNDSFAAAAGTHAALKEAIAELEPNLRGYAGQNTASPSATRTPSKTKPRVSDSKRKAT
jgi:two-component system, sensor histidine kinase and response regulator